MLIIKRLDEDEHGPALWSGSFQTPREFSLSIIIKIIELFVQIKSVLFVQI